MAVITFKQWYAQQRSEIPAHDLRMWIEYIRGTNGLYKTLSLFLGLPTFLMDYECIAREVGLELDICMKLLECVSEDCGFRKYLSCDDVLMWNRTKRVDFEVFYPKEVLDYFELLC